MTGGTIFRSLAVGAMLLPVAPRLLWGADPPAREFRISGVVVSARDGSPVPYCRLTAFALLADDKAPSRNGEPSPQRPDRNQGTNSAAPARTPASEARADASGKFSLDVPHGGSWRLSAVARGFRAQNYDEHEGFYSAVVLSESKPALALTFHLIPDSVLTGVILDDSGEPVIAAQVMLELISPTTRETSGAARPRQVGGAPTDDRGRYEIGGLAPGEYRLRVQAHPWFSIGNRGMVQLRGNLGTQTNSTPPPDPSLDFVYPVTWFPGVDDESTAEAIKIAPGEEREADLRLTAIPSIHLKVSRTEVPDAVLQDDTKGQQAQQRMISINRVGGGPGPGIQQTMMPVGASGSEWDFGGLAPGTYEVRLPGTDGRSSDRRSGDVRRIEIKPGSPAVLTMENAKALVPVQLEFDGIPNSQATALEFVDTETGERIPSQSPQRGRGGFQGGPLDDRENQGSNQEPTGRTVLLEPHSYEIWETSGPAAYLTGIQSDGGGKIAGRVVTIAGPATIKLHLASKHAQLDGVARIGQEPAAGAMVLLVPATFGTAGALTAIQRAETATDGSFRLVSVTPGPYILVAIDHGWNVDWRNPATLGQYLLHGAPVKMLPDATDHQELEAVMPN